MKDSKSDPSDRPLASSDLQDRMQQTFSDYLVMQTTCSSVVNQAHLNLGKVPTLSDNQVRITHDVGLYRIQYHAYQLAVFDLVIGYDTLFQAFAEELLAQAKGWDQGGDGQAFKAGLAVLGRTSGYYSKQVGDYVKELDSYDSLSISKNLLVYQNEEAQVLKTYAGSSGDIARRRAELETLSGQMDRANRAIATGAGRQVLKISKIALDVGFAAAEVPGLGSIVVDTVFSFAEDAASDDEAVLRDSKDLIARYQQHLEAILAEQLELAVLATLSLNLDRFLSGVRAMRATMERVSRAWDDVSRGLAALGAYNTAPSPNFFADQIRDAQASWASLARKAQDFLNAISTFDWTRPRALS